MKEKFILKFVEKYGNIIDFSNFVYINDKTKTIFKCKKHGCVEMSPRQVYIGGLKCCNEENRYNIQKDKVFKQINEKHGNEYDLSLIDKYSIKDKIQIICKIHGIFNTSISNFVYSGKGCKKCSDDSKKMTIDDFILRANKIHNHKYDYSLVNYINIKTKIKIICSKHGEFEMTPFSHLNKNKCHKCHLENITTTFLEFEGKARLRHNNYYTYYEESFSGSSKKVKINCPKHGDFEQYAKDHAKGSKCYKCSNSNIDNILIELNNLKTKYDYSLVKEDFKTLKTKVRIICPEHGEFLQNIYNHKNGTGCPVCKESKGEKIITNFLKENKIHYIPQKKFDSCINKRKLPFDFYLPDYNICIEYDGKQHFEINDFFGGLESFEMVKINDKIKTDYCFDNNITLIRINKENIKDKLNNFLNNI